VDDRPPKPTPRPDRAADPPHLSPEASAALAAASAALAALEAPLEPSPQASVEGKMSAASTEKPPSVAESPAAIGPIAADAAPALAWRGSFLMMIVLLVLMFAGAAGAGWLFREPLTRAMTRWHFTR
jgi:hypothetical protein